MPRARMPWDGRRETRRGGGGWGGGWEGTRHWAGTREREIYSSPPDRTRGQRSRRLVSSVGARLRPSVRRCMCVHCSCSCLCLSRPYGDRDRQNSEWHCLLRSNRPSACARRPPRFKFSRSRSRSRSSTSARSGLKVSNSSVGQVQVSDLKLKVEPQGLKSRSRGRRYRCVFEIRHHGPPE